MVRVMVAPSPGKGPPLSGDGLTIGALVGVTTGLSSSCPVGPAAERATGVAVPAHLGVASAGIGDEIAVCVGDKADGTGSGIGAWLGVHVDVLVGDMASMAVGMELVMLVTGTGVDTC
jgi:hypothetical protein